MCITNKQDEQIEQLMLVELSKLDTTTIQNILWNEDDGIDYLVESFSKAFGQVVGQLDMELNHHENCFELATVSVCIELDKVYESRRINDFKNCKCLQVIAEQYYIQGDAEEIQSYINKELLKEVK